MTEYDFSPAAIQRHFDTQARISRWAQSTSSLPQKDPFAPPTPVGPAPPHPKRKESDRRRARSSDRDRDREHRDRDRSRRCSPPPPTLAPRDFPPRPQTAPPPQGFGVYPAPVQPYFPAGFYGAPPRQDTHRRSRSTAQAPAPPPHTRSRSYSVAQAMLQPMRTASYPPPNANYPPLPPGYGYAQPSPAFAQLPPGAQPAPVYAPQTHPQAMRSPTREVSLFKRVFGWSGAKGLSREKTGRSRDSGRGRDGYREKERDGRRERTPRRGDSY